MRRTEFFVINSFTKKAFEGNPAAVILDAEVLTTDTMLKIARQFNLVETVFVTTPSTEADFDFSLRYFTPTEEVSIAIHPTIAAFVALSESGTLDSSGGPWIINTKTGNRRVTTLKGHETFLVEAVPPTFYPVVNERSAVARTFGLEEKDLSAEFPIQPVDTGLGHLIVPVSSLDALMKVRRDIPALKQLCSSVGVREAQLFTLDVYDKMYDLHTRNLCPREGIEDPGCGVGNAALAAYLFSHLDRRTQERMFLAEQGVVNKMPCLIETHVRHADNGIQVLVGGSGKVMIRGILDF